MGLLGTEAFLSLISWSKTPPSMTFSPFQMAEQLVMPIKGGIARKPPEAQLKDQIRRPPKAMAPHSSTLAWKIPWTEEPGGCSPWGCEESDTTERLHFHFSLSCTGRGNGSPLQCSCLENPRDSGAWWPAVYGVAQSRTRLKQLSSSSSSMLNFASQMITQFLMKELELFILEPIFHFPFYVFCSCHLLLFKYFSS